jgi:hypothetical protein
MHLARLWAISFLLVSLATGAQTTGGTDRAQKDAEGLRLLSSLYGGLKTHRSATDSTVTGTVTVKGISYPVVLKTRGNQKVRVETTLPGGTSTYIFNEQRGETRDPAGKVKELSPYNSATRRIGHLPHLSLLYEYDRDYLDIGKPKAVDFKGRPALEVRVNMHFQISDPKILERAREQAGLKFTLDPIDGRVLRVEKRLVSENSPYFSTASVIEYSDYRLIDGVLVPFLQVTSHDGREVTRLQLDSVVFQQGLPDAEFELSPRRQK